MSSSSLNNNETIKVLGAGFARTGTTSLKNALEVLGYKCYHYVEVYKNLKTHPNLWIQAFNEQYTTDFDLIFKENELLPYTATVDWPSAAVWEQIWKQYPNAKVILTVRNSESWYKSVKNTIYRCAQEFPCWCVEPRSTRRMENKLVWQGTFQNRFEDKQYAIEVYEKHNQRVKELVPRDQLLILDITKDGAEVWTELCEFLGVSKIPDVQFPRANDGENFEKIIAKHNRIGWLRISMVFIPILVGLLSLILYFFF